MRKKSSARFDSENVRHVAEAAFADATARSISSIEANCTSPACSPVAGLYTGPVRPDSPATGSPPIQCPITFSAVVTAALISAPPASSVVLASVPPSGGCGLRAPSSRTGQRRVLGREVDRLVAVLPADAIALVAGIAEDRQDHRGLGRV